MLDMAHLPQAFETTFLEEENGHRVFFSRYGNPNGQALIVLHGGPGSESKAKQVKGFDLARFQVITFDQRGCGKSEPAGKTEFNTLQDLISDMERIRETLAITSWYVAGGSWGATLALAYAQAHPEHVRGLLLSSIFLANGESTQWSFTGDKGVKKLFPDVWEERQRFLEHYQTTPQNAAQVLLSRLTNAPITEAQHIASGVMNWEGNLMNAQEDITYTSSGDVGESDINSVKIFLHYQAHDFFLAPDQILANMAHIAEIPCMIVHGRYDVLCTVEEMWLVQQRLKNCDYLILPSSNHRLTAEGEIARKLAFKLFLEKH